MTTELTFRRDGVAVLTSFKNPITGNETRHEDFVPYSELPKKMSMLGISEIKPDTTENEWGIRFAVENVSMEKVTPALTGLRKGTRIERIARFLMERKGKAYTTRELADAVEVDPSKADLANVQWEATRLVREHSGFKSIKKNDLMAYMYA